MSNSGMVGLLSDAHGNLQAFQRGIDVLRAHGARRFIFLGDAVGYVPGSGVVEALRRFPGGITCLKGNHDEMLMNRCWTLERDPVYQLSTTRLAVSEANLAFMATWPERYEACYGDHKVLCIHGGPADPVGQYVYPDSPLEESDGLADFVFMGHTHRPFRRQTFRTTWVNVGSCGLPRDHGQLGCVCLFDPDQSEIQLLRYDISDIVGALRARHSLHASVDALFDRRVDPVIGIVTGVHTRETK